MPRLRLALCQLDAVVGDVRGNADRILETLARAEEAGADLAAFPELAITGYPPEDLLLKPAFIADNLAALDRVASATGSCAALVGYVGVVLPGSDTGSSRGAPRGLHNAVALCRDGRVLASYQKRLLPNYGVFDEERWFAPGRAPLELFEIAGVRVGTTICEDLWFADGPVAALGRGGAQLVVNINASPYSRRRTVDRLEVMRARAVEAGCAVAYVNQVGGQDELVFDGASMVVDLGGEVVAAAGSFREELLLVDLQVPAGPRPEGGLPVVPVSGEPCDPLPAPPGPRPAPLDADDEVYEALVLGTRDYLRKNGFTDAVIGLSGGIDSALVATVAVDAVGADHVHGLAMPSRYSSEGSVADARDLAQRLGIGLDVVPIETLHCAYADLLGPLLGGPPSGLTDENLQSRLRGVVLMAVSNARGWIVLTTGNKSELAVGYSTLYGDSAGGFAVIKDVPKSLVYRLCRSRNARAGGPVIPELILTKPPSAELRPDQRDDQSLPPYDVLDPILAGLVEDDRSVADLVREGFDPAVVARVAGLVDLAEYKRRQSPPGVRITGRAFGKDRRMPITNRYVFEGIPARPGAGATPGAGPPAAEEQTVDR